jgi:hypothetical protein
MEPIKLQNIMEDSAGRHLGDLVNLIAPKDDVSPQQVHAVLGACKLREPTPAKALKTAARRSASEGVLLRNVATEDGRTAIGVVVEGCQAAHLNYDHAATLSVNGSSYLRTEGENPVLDIVSTKYEATLGKYTGADISREVRRRLDAMGAVPYSGAVIFVPTQYRESVRNLAPMFAALGGRMDVMPLFDTVEAKRLLQRTAAEHMAAELQQLLQESVELQGPTAARKHSVETRYARLDAIRLKLASYEESLGLVAAEMTGAIAQVSNALAVATLGTLYGENAGGVQS